MDLELFLGRAWAFFLKDLKQNFSYRLPYLLDLVGVASNLLIFFFIAKLLSGNHPALASYGGDYFSFVMIGIAFSGFQTASLNSFSEAVSREQDDGALEAILMTSTSLWTVLFAGSFWHFIWTLIRVLLYLLLGALVFGINLSHLNFASTVAAMILTMTSLAGLGIFSAGFMLVYKRGNPFIFLLNGISKFLSGVYFPVSVLPHWLYAAAKFLPLTYSLEAVRLSLFRGDSLGALKVPILVLCLYTALLLPLGVFFFNRAIRQSKKEGSLSFR